MASKSTTTNNTPFNETIPSIAFDPKSPSSLLIAHHSNVTSPSSPSSSTSSPTSQFQSLSSDDGTGCNAEETQCLMRLIDIHNNSFTTSSNDSSSLSIIHQNSSNTNTGINTNINTNTSHPNKINSQKLSQAYRKQIVDCIEQWEVRIDDETLENMKNMNSANEETTKQQDVEYRNKDLLKVTLAITHLAEIYLCSGSNTNGDDDEDGQAQFGQDGIGGSIMNFMDDDNDDYSLQLLSSTPTRSKNAESNQMGVVTADTIRYLRYHHLNDIHEYVENLLNDEISIEDLLSLKQPEHWRPSTMQQQQQKQKQHKLTPYWALVRKLIQRGLLKDAWDVLRSHSACIRAEMKFASGEDKNNSIGARSGRGSSFIDQTIREDMEGFLLIQKILLFAPLPGGRTELNDCCLGEENHSEIDEDDGVYDDDDENGANWWNGMTFNAYKLWDTNGDTSQNVQDAPTDFNIYAVMNLFNSWKMRVSQALRTNMALRNLTRRIPNLQTCVWDVILSTQESFDDIDDTWAERLVAELLYIRPDIRKDDVSIRAMVHMKHCGVLIDDDPSKTKSGSMDNIVLEVMKGNVGSVIEALQSLGGASGAALPATMMALLCCLLVDDGQIRLSELSYDLRTENLLSASCAIISSFTMQNHSEIGIRLSTKLLQNYITPENMQITGHVAATLSSHYPRSDAEVRGILKMCADAIERGSFRILDACESLCFSRSQFYKRTQSFGSMVAWLIRGIECASRLGAEEREDGIRTDLTRSMNFRQLTLTTYDMATSLLAALCKKDSGSDEDVSKLVQMTKHCKDVQGVIMGDTMADIINADPSVSLFINVSSIGWGIIEKNDKQVARAIIQCLEERNDLDGSMIAIAPPKLYGYFLTLAFDILHARSESSIGEINHSSEPFNVNDMQVLFCCLEFYCNRHKFGHTNCSCIREDITVDELRVSLGKGLMRAFVAQNDILREEKLQTRKKKQQSELPVNLDDLLGMSM